MDPTNGKGPAYGMGSSSKDSSMSSGRSESIEMPEETDCFKTDYTDGEFGVNAVFEDSRYFDKVESTDVETKYEAADITVRVDSSGGAVEYAVDSQSDHSQAVQEFVDGIVHGIEDVNPDFREEIEDEIYSKAVADGGRKTGMPYGGSSSTVEPVSESENHMGDYPM